MKVVITSVLIILFAQYLFALNLSSSALHEEEKLALKQRAEEVAEKWIRAECVLSRVDYTYYRGQLDAVLFITALCNFLFVTLMLLLARRLPVLAVYVGLMCGFMAINILMFIAIIFVCHPYPRDIYM